MKTNGEFFFSNYPFLLREICSFGYYIFTITWLGLLGLFVFCFYVVMPIAAVFVLLSWILKALGKL